MSTGDAPEVKKASRQVVSRLKQERERRAWTQSEVAERIGTTQINVSRWENGTTFPSPYYRQRLAELFGKSVEELGLIPQASEKYEAPTFSDISVAANASFSSQIWNVPYHRNPFFTGREETLTYLHTVLRSSKSAALTQAQAISGLGGIGKTQTAVEYAYRYRDRYQAVLWINASSREVFSADFIMLAALLDLPEQYEQDQEIIILAVKRWLSAHPDWLLILDNVDSLTTLADFLPLYSKGNVLLTTRLQALGVLARRIEVEKMGLEEGAIFLLRRSKLLAPDAAVERAMREHQAQALAIVEALDGLPLALDQAGAYIEETRCSLSRYLDLYATRRKELLLRRGRLPADHPESVAATWSLSFQEVKQENPAAADLLCLLAFLDPEAIAEEIITLGAEELGPALAPLAGDALEVDEILEVLLSYSLIRRAPEVGALSTHRLVQAVLKDGMESETRRLWAERAIRAVNRAFPDVELRTWKRCQRCLSHVQACILYASEYELAFPEAARLFNEAAAYLVAHAQYDQAEMLLEKALTIRQQVLEPDHPDTARTLNDLGLLYLTQGSYQQAEPLLQQSLTIRRQRLGEEHPDTASSLNNLALLYYKQGRYPLAEQLYLAALDIRRKVLKYDHQDIGQNLKNLAELYTVMGKYAQAESLYAEALANQKKILDQEHPTIAETLNNLALLYRSMGEYAQAERYYQQALETQEQVLGLDHPDVAETLNNLAQLYRAMGVYEQAEPLYQQAFTIRESVFGADHPLVAQSYYSMAKFHYSQDSYLEAEKLCKQALRIQEQRLGINHPTLASTLGLLAKIYQGQQKLAQAEELNLRALLIRESSSGSDHPQMATIINSLIEIYHAEGRYREAEPLIARSLAIHEQALGSEHPYMAYSLSNKADNCFLQGDYTQAELYYKQALAIREQHLGTEHLRTASTYYKLAELYNTQGRYEEASVLYFKTLAIRKNTLGSNHSATLALQVIYTTLLDKMKKE